MLLEWIIHQVDTVGGDFQRHRGYQSNWLPMKSSGKKVVMHRKEHILQADLEQIYEIRLGILETFTSVVTLLLVPECPSHISFEYNTCYHPKSCLAPTPEDLSHDRTESSPCIMAKPSLSLDIM